MDTVILTRWGQATARVVAALLFAILLLHPVGVLADDATEVALFDGAAPENGVSAVLGPRLGVSGTPTSLQVRGEYWRQIHEQFSFLATAGMTVSGETTLEGDDGVTPDATYSSTFGGTFSAGIRMALDFDWPVDSYAFGTLAVSFLGSGGLIGYTFGPAGGMGVTYGISEGLDLIGEVEVGAGYGQFKGSAGEFAVSLDALVGAQVTF